MVGKQARRFDRAFKLAALARRLVPTTVNQLWVADITYIRLAETFVYLAVVLDAHSRRMVGWAMADHLRAERIRPATAAAVRG